MSKWDEDEIIGPTVKRGKGRPVENPFCSAESEEDFDRRGRAMLQAYFKPAGPNKRHDFEFARGLTMSKTQFWAILFIYLVENKILKDNLQGFLFAVIRHFGAAVVSDRASISKNIKTQEQLYVTTPHIHALTGAKGKAQDTYNKQYKFVIKRWENA